MSGFIILILLLCFVSSWAVFNFIKLSNAMAEVLVENYRSVLAAENMITAIERQDSGVLLYLLNNKDFGQELIDTHHNEFMIWFGREEENITVPGEAEIVKKILDEYNVYLSMINKLKFTELTEGRDKATDYYNSDIYPNFVTIRNECKSLLEINHQTIIDRDKIAKTMAKKAIWSTILISVVSVLLGLVWGLYSSKFIVSPILQLTDKVRSIAQGDVNAKISIKTNDEIGILAQEFNIMTQHLKEYQNSNIAQLIMERRKSEAIVEEISDGLIMVDKDKKISIVNKAAEKIFNIDEHKVIGKHFLEVIKDNYIFPLLEKVMEGREFNDDVKTIEKIINGTKKYYTIEISKIEGEEKVVEGAVLLFGDVTHFKEIDEMKSDFVSTVSHEFRSPLTSIEMGIELLLESDVAKDGTKEKELMKAIDEESKRLKRLVNELLDLSRVESGKIVMNFESLDMADMVETAIKSFEIQAGEKGLKLNNMIKDRSVYRVTADADKILLVLSNLIANAIRYTAKGGLVQINAESKGNKVYIAVEDTGTGIPAKYHNIIFEKFTQVKNDGISVGGAGLGLAIVKEIIKVHGGRIWVESEEGKGSKFIFTLPMEKENACSI